MAAMSASAFMVVVAPCFQYKTGVIPHKGPMSIFTI